MTNGADQIRYTATPYHLERCTKPIAACPACADFFKLKGSS